MNPVNPNNELYEELGPWCNNGTNGIEATNLFLMGVKALSMGGGKHMLRYCKSGSNPCLGS